jgi:NAD(P)-dependent dehydrogenase (short-subunit alcohol dehydrogenase family)
VGTLASIPSPTLAGRHALVTGAGRGIGASGARADSRLQRSLDNVVAKTGRSADEARAEFARHNPQGRLVQPEEVADTVAWLCGAGTAAINGQSISVAGGEVM